jgi:hypothetical protein
MLAESGFDDVSVVALESIEAGVVADCGFSLFEMAWPETRQALDQIKAAIEAVRTEAGADVQICFVATAGPNIAVAALDEPTLRHFRYEAGELTEAVETEPVECAGTTDDVLASHIDILHDFLDEHPATDGFSLKYWAEPELTAHIDPGFGNDVVFFDIDQETGETLGTNPVPE